ncbi:uncharacterized protein LOC125040138 isoform X2 [Penaeus chinensis]|nr:uncharacterized protein LOC125040138 isoform X2 [Penaeus chinensis]
MKSLVLSLLLLCFVCARGIPTKLKCDTHAAEGCLGEEAGPSVVGEVEGETPDTMQEETKEEAFPTSSDLPATSELPPQDASEAEGAGGGNSGPGEGESGALQAQRLVSGKSIEAATPGNAFGNDTEAPVGTRPTEEGGEARQGRKLALDDPSAKEGSYVLQTQDPQEEKDLQEGGDIAFERIHDLLEEEEGGDLAEHDYYDYDLSNPTPVRKCCGADEFFSLQLQRCEDVGGDHTFLEAAGRLLLGEGGGGALSYITGRIPVCPGTGKPPTIAQSSEFVHQLLPHGHLRELDLGLTHDVDHYCLEMAAVTKEEVANAALVLASCPRGVFRHVRKCCALHQYLDRSSMECMDRPANSSSHETLVREFLHPNADTSHFHFRTERFQCPKGFPKIMHAQELYLDDREQLCERDSGVCYQTSLFCLDHLTAEDEDPASMEAVAAVCLHNFFSKCCPPGHTYSEDGCVATHAPPSSKMMQLSELMESDHGFPLNNDTCPHEVIWPHNRDIRWWINWSGELNVDSHDSTFITEHYCVDDFLDKNNETVTVAVLCRTELENIIPVHLSSQASSSDAISSLLPPGTVGKCCKHGHNVLKVDGVQNVSCAGDDHSHQLLNESEVRSAGISRLVYSGFPVCRGGGGLHVFYLPPVVDDDYARFSQGGQTADVVSMEGSCVLSTNSFRKEEYCLDYIVKANAKGQGRTPRAMVVVCPEAWKSVNVHQEKYSITSVLLGISCSALIATVISLLSSRVRRGLVTVKKVNTLAGRILLSYVISYLFSFLLLAISMKAEVQQDAECHLIAGLLIFFILAGFTWNTSICLESLLLTLRVSTSERWRYLYHSLWAWGVPAAITTLALTLDHYRKELPCAVVTPRIGLYRCFFSDPNAQLLYMHLPLFLTLVANVGLLMGARILRSAKLRKLEHGGNKKKASTPAGGGAGGTTAGGGGRGSEWVELNRQTAASGANGGSSANTSSDQSGHTQPASSGLRTHQTRNLWTESIKLVVWSGATWMLELASFVVTNYLVTPSEAWYDYLWYLPSTMNALRGVGIFSILVLTPENRIKVAKALGNLGSWAGSGTLGRPSRSEAHSSSGNHASSSGGGGGGSAGAPEAGRSAGRRNMSISTTITQITSSFRSAVSIDPRPDTAAAAAAAAAAARPGGGLHPRVAHSVSQIDTRRSSVSSESSSEGFELDAEAGAGGRRKSSIAANFGMVSLPSVDEEDVFDDSTAEASATHAPLDATRSYSNA